MGRRRAPAWVALSTALLATAGCASTIQGSGSVSRAPSSASSHDFPSASASAVPTATAPATQSAPPSTPPSAAPSEVPAPKECASASDCKLVKSWDVGGGYIVGVFSAPSAANGIGSSVLLLGRDQTPVFWHVFEGETPSELLCKVAGTLRNCVLVNYVGAHAATGYPLLVDGDRIDIGKSIGSDTPGLHAGDLDHDLLVDAYGLQNNYKPDYASGHVQWQTWRRTSDGTALTSTGCGALSAAAPKAPKTFLTGTCDSG